MEVYVYDNNGDLIRLKDFLVKYANTSNYVTKLCRKSKLTPKKKKLRFDYAHLIEFCKLNNIVLRKNYKNVRVVRDTKIVAKCYNCEKNMVTKSFRELIQNKNFGCKICRKFLIRTKFEATSIAKFGVKYPMQCNSVKQKIVQTNMVKYGKHPSKVEAVKLKLAATNMQKYGKKCPMQNNEIIQKMKAANIMKYGVAHPSQCAETNQKRINTNMEKYGVKYTLQHESVKQKSQATNMRKRGVINPGQCPIVKQKSKETNLRNYGCEYPIQNAEFAEKHSKAAYKIKDFILPSGNIIKVQGYEPWALTELLDLESINEDDIVTDKRKVPEIWYTNIDNKRCRYYVDIYIPSQNRCIEVKSTWTAEKKKDCIFLKQQAVKNAGYDCEIWVYNDKKVKVQCHT